MCWKKRRKEGKAAAMMAKRLSVVGLVQSSQRYLPQETCTVENRASLIGSTVPMAGLILTRRNIPNIMTGTGARKMSTRRTFW